jgi:nucleotide-binding universal stress UspA family protein
MMNSEREVRILISVRGLIRSEPTLRFGSLIAELLKAQITLLTVIDEEAERKSAEDKLERAREMFPGHAVDTKIYRSQDAAKKILVELEQENYVMAVVGSAEPGILANLLFKTVTKDVVGKADFPVLVVRGERESIQRILICTGGQKIPKTMIRLGAKLAGGADGEITLLYVTSPVPSMYTGMEEIEETLPELMQTDTKIARHLRLCVKLLDKCGVPANLKLRHGVVVNEILREAYKGDYDIILLGAHSITPWWRDIMTGNVTSQVINQSPCPVLVVQV